jgi:hypothetical protein
MSTRLEKVIVEILDKFGPMTDSDLVRTLSQFDTGKVDVNTVNSILTTSPAQFTQTEGVWTALMFAIPIFSLFLDNMHRSANIHP